MTEKEKAETEKVRAETIAVYHNIALKWYTAITATALGATPLIDYLKDLFK